MFVDNATVLIRAGNGGNGRASFRHEKYIDKGGPDGGDGGRGGDVIVVASRNENTLVNFRFQKELQAEHGGAGDKRNKHGRNGKPLVVNLPVGTVIVAADGSVVADLVQDGQRVVIAKGGNGGFGNAHFVSSRRQAPTVAEKGEAGEELDARLELKMIADVGLVGLPNAGKSTLLSVISNARPEIANYPFTTLTPNLGVVDVDAESSMLFADIPGLIEGAAEGKGLGDEFLRHVERTAVIVHLIDAYQDNPEQAYRTIQQELAAYKIDLASRPQVVLLTKIEGLDDEMVADLLARLKKIIPKSTPLLAISAIAKKGLKEMLRKVRTIVDAERAKAKEIAQEIEQPAIPTLTLQGKEEDAWQVDKNEDGVFVVSGKKIERFAARTHFDQEEGRQRLRDIMQKMGIMHALRRQGVNPGDTIQIGSETQTLTY